MADPGDTGPPRDGTHLGGGEGFQRGPVPLTELVKGNGRLFVEADRNANVPLRARIALLLFSGSRPWWAVKGRRAAAPTPHPSPQGCGVTADAASICPLGWATSPTWRDWDAQAGCFVM